MTVIFSAAIDFCGDATHSKVASSLPLNSLSIRSYRTRIRIAFKVVIWKA